jgi:uncharacterized cupin superfamily protein
MNERKYPIAMPAAEVPAKAKSSNYPEPFFSRMAGRQKRALGDAFGLKNFGVNLTRLAPGAVSALHHAHSVQDEFIYILQGTPTLVTGTSETLLQPGLCAGFRGGSGEPHHLANRSDRDVVYLEVGDRLPGDSGSYPDDDIQAAMGGDGQWKFTHKDGSPY